MSHAAFGIFFKNHFTKWEKDGYKYSCTFDTGVSKNTMLSILKKVCGACKCNVSSAVQDAFRILNGFLSKFGRKQYRLYYPF